MMTQKTAIQIDREKKRYVHQSTLQDLQQAVRTQLSTYHQKHPLKSGMPKEELKSRLPSSVDIKLFMLVLQQMGKTEAITVEEDIVRLSAHRVALGVDQRALRENILNAYAKGGLTPPYFKDLCQEWNTPVDQARQVLALLVDEGLMLKIKEDLYYHHQPIAELKQKLIEYLTTHEEISTPQFKDMTGASRKFVIPLIEFFDGIQLTIRIGDMRKLRKRPT
jgi:selenocysteine-specific elongation factor